MATVNISFPDKLLKEIDIVARQETRSRSELLRAASRMYVERRRRWDQLVAVVRAETKRRGITPADIERAIAEVRAERRSA